MDQSAPITWLINQINTIVASGASSAAGAIATAITPLVSICFGIYVMLITINYLRGAETEPVMDFGMRCVGFAIVISMGLNAANYTSMVIPIVTGLGGDLANAVSGGTVTANSLDTLALAYLQIINDGFTAADGFSGFTYIGTLLLVVLKSIIVIIGLVPFLVAATLAIIVANTGSFIVAMVGPIFFGCLLFPATRQYFSAWVNTAFSYALIPLMVAVIATISVGLSKTMMTQAGGGAGGTLIDASFTSVFLCAIGNLILLFLIKQVSALASSLSAGGINAAMPGGIGSAASAIGARHGVGRGMARGMASGARGAVSGARWVASKINSNSIRKAG